MLQTGSEVCWFEAPFAFSEVGSAKDMVGTGGAAKVFETSELMGGALQHWAALGFEA